MTIQQVIAKLFEAEVTGMSICHFLEKRKGRPYSGYILTNGEIIFEHDGPYYELTNIPVTLELHDAIEIVKEYWDRRI